MTELTLHAAGRPIPRGVDGIRRYCGLRWSGGDHETWAWPSYDAVPTPHDNHVGPVDVLCVAALHPGLGRADLSFFRDRRDDIAGWLAVLPPDAELWEVPDELAAHVAGLADRFPEVAISLLSKVLHKKRPHLIPLLDRHVVDWYRPITGRRAMADAWPAIVQAMQDEQKNPEWRFVTAMALQPIGADLKQVASPDGGPGLSPLRAVDIAIWMSSHPSASSEPGAGTDRVRG